MPMKPPKTFYKYRTFDTRLVEQLCLDQVYFADPSTFNDPMDSNPCVENDVDIKGLEEILTKLLTRRLRATMHAAANQVGYRGPRTKEHIEERARRLVNETLRNVAYNATDPEYMQDIQVVHADLLVQHIEEELIRQYDRGILSLARRNNCPLMWSHYGGQHTGLCVGYEMPKSLKNLPQAPQQVQYGGSRKVPASMIAAMLDGSDEARDSVDRMVFLTKAMNWRYEKEWRLIGIRGAAHSTMELTEVIFGMRCPEAVMFSVAKTLEDRRNEVRLYKIREVPGTFKLQRVRIRLADFDEDYPYRGVDRLETAEEFEAMAT